jgi:hypothetical protein
MNINVNKDMGMDMQHECELNMIMDTDCYRTDELCHNNVKYMYIDIVIPWNY